MAGHLDASVWKLEVGGDGAVDAAFFSLMFFMSYGRLFGHLFFFFFSHALLHMSTILALKGAHIQANVIML